MTTKVPTLVFGRGAGAKLQVGGAQLPQDGAP